MSFKQVFTAAGIVALQALAFPAAAKVTEIFTISDFQPTIGGVQLSSIQSVAGGWTQGTTGADDTSNVTVVENAQGQLASYSYTGPENGPGWSVQSQFTGSPFFKASFRINPVGAGPVTTGLMRKLALKKGDPVN